MATPYLRHRLIALGPVAHSGARPVSPSLNLYRIDNDPDATDLRYQATAALATAWDVFPWYNATSTSWTPTPTGCPAIFLRAIADHGRINNFSGAPWAPPPPRWCPSWVRLVKTLIGPESNSATGCLAKTPTTSNKSTPSGAEFNSIPHFTFVFLSPLVKASSLSSVVTVPQGPSPVDYPPVSKMEKSSTKPAAGSAELKIDLISPDVAASGWMPTLSKKPITLDASIGGGIKVNAKATIGWTLEVLDTGLQIRIGLEPWAGGTLTVASSSGAACTDDPQKHHFG
ncbi:uncharacterized protein N7482_004872 [Penicillium canariense]|uniref:Uncharacterized protein n=1 Tax=Penicillium canariense TaxID=189055 RepID=A0A9W9LMG8_9EURO|nr:uncharacterized protein N7482_004872 [Penicillium canariense]KAJ5166091.1 hypothetical protein N7482_004872 [Penicillium canariense]